MFLERLFAGLRIPIPAILTTEGFGFIILAFFAMAFYRVLTR